MEAEYGRFFLSNYQDGPQWWLDAVTPAEGSAAALRTGQTPAADPVPAEPAPRADADAAAAAPSPSPAPIAAAAASGLAQAVVAGFSEPDRGRSGDAAGPPAPQVKPSSSGSSSGMDEGPTDLPAVQPGLLDRLGPPGGFPVVSAAASANGAAGTKHASSEAAAREGLLDRLDPPEGFPVVSAAASANGAVGPKHASSEVAAREGGGSGDASSPASAAPVMTTPTERSAASSGAGAAGSAAGVGPLLGGRLVARGPDAAEGAGRAAAASGPQLEQAEGKGGGRPCAKDPGEGGRSTSAPAANTAAGGAPPSPPTKAEAPSAEAPRRDKVEPVTASAELAKVKKVTAEAAHTKAEPVKASAEPAKVKKVTAESAHTKAEPVKASAEPAKVPAEPAKAKPEPVKANLEPAKVTREAPTAKAESAKAEEEAAKPKPQSSSHPTRPTQQLPLPLVKPQVASLKPDQQGPGVLSEVDAQVGAQLDAFFANDRLWQKICEMSAAGSPLPADFSPESQRSGTKAAFRVQVPKPYPGVQYRKSRNLEDRYPNYAANGIVITGQVVDGGEWLRIKSNVFLPMRVGAVRILEPVPGDGAVAVEGATDDCLPGGPAPDGLCVFCAGGADSAGAGGEAVPAAALVNASPSASRSSRN